MGCLGPWAMGHSPSFKLWCHGPLEGPEGRLRPMSLARHFQLARRVCFRCGEAPMGGARLIIRREFRGQTSDNMDRWKSSGEKSPGGEEKKWEDQRREREREERRGEKVGTSRFSVFFNDLWLRRVESRLAKAVGSWPEERRKIARCCGAKHISKSKCTKHTNVGPLLEVDMSKKCTPLWREAHVQVKSAQNWRSWTTFGSWDVEKVHAVVARSKCPSQKCKKLTVLDHFRKLRCRKSARGCGAKHMSKSEV